MKLRLRLTQIPLVNWLIAIVLAIMFGTGSYIFAPRFLPEVFIEYPWALDVISILIAVGGFGMGLNMRERTTEKDEKTKI